MTQMDARDFVAGLNDALASDHTEACLRRQGITDIGLGSLRRSTEETVERAEFRLSDPGGLVLDSSALAPESNAARVFIAGLFFQMMRDGATHLAIDLAPGHAALHFVLDGQEYEMVPPDAFLSDELPGELCVRFGIPPVESPDVQDPAAGKEFPVRFRAEWSVSDRDPSRSSQGSLEHILHLSRFKRFSSGETCYFLRLEPCNPA